MNDHSAGYVDLPRTAYLDHTLRRARTAAEQRSHRYVTLEHLLFALMDDPDAVNLLQATGADFAAIRVAAADTVNNKMSALAVPDGRAPSFSYKFDALFAGISEDAMHLGRREVDGALALVAIAKDRDSGAASILAANGFHPQTAFQAFAHPASAAPALAPQAAPASITQPPLAAPAQYRPEPQQPQALAAGTAFQTAAAASSNSLMEDMLTSVRNILDAEERRERGLPPAPAPTLQAQPRIEPQLRIDASPGAHGGRSPAPLVPTPAPMQAPEWAGAGPSLNPAAPPPRGPLARPHFAPGFSEQTGPSFDHPSLPVPEPGRKRRDGKARRGAEPQAPLTRLLEGIPRRLQKGTPVTIELHLSKEDAAALFARMGRRGQPQLGPEPHVTSRAVTLRLSAPEGGFSAEPLTHETQWIFERPSFLGEEQFGVWAWAITPNEKGSFAATVSVFARDIDGGGLAGELKLPDQEVRVRVHGSFWRGLASFLSAILLLLAGSGLTVGAWYALKVMGKLPN